MTQPLRRRLGVGLVAAGKRVAWLAAATLLAFGSAGIVAGMDHPPGTARPELTWAADRAISPGLESAVADLSALSREVEQVSKMGRLALASLTAQSITGLSAAVADGTTLVEAVKRDTEALRSRLANLPGGGPRIERRLGPATLDRYDRVVAALSSTSGLSDDWATFAGGADLASQLTVLLADHDRRAAEAAREGSTGAYGMALTELAQATAALKTATTLRDALANSADTSTLDQWLQRNRALDAALHDLYAALLSSRGQVTSAVRNAVAAEKAAQANLPPDTRALVVIMSDIARGGLNQAVISIEGARGKLAAALEDLTVPSASSQPAPNQSGPTPP